MSERARLLNKLADDERSVVHEVAGTTVDPVDSLIDLGGKIWRFVDTAGLRRKVGQASGHEFYASVRTHRCDRRGRGGHRADRRLGAADRTGSAGHFDGHRGRAGAGGGVQQMGHGRRGPARYSLDREIDVNWQVRWAQRVNISAKTGRAVQKLVPAMEGALESWDARIGDRTVEQLDQEVVAANPPPVRGGKQPRILFATQATARPPTFVLFTTGFLEAGYRRFLERRLRETFGFEGSPIGSTCGCGRSAVRSAAERVECRRPRPRRRACLQGFECAATAEIRRYSRRSRRTRNARSAPGCGAVGRERRDGGKPDSRLLAWVDGVYASFA